MKEFVKWHHKNVINKILNVGNYYRTKICFFFKTKQKRGGEGGYVNKIYFRDIHQT